MIIKTIKDVDLKDKKVVLRADINVPYEGKTVTDTTRIDRLKPTIDHLRGAGAKIIIISHLGRPKGAPDPAFSLEFLTPALAESWQAPVIFASDCIGESARTAANNLQAGEILLLENLRFHAGEKENDPAFVKELAALGDIYVNDAFSVSHRAHASTAGLAAELPALAGLLMAQELDALQKALEAPEKPVMAVAGGSKISTKLSVLRNLSAKVDYLVLGGAMANTFMYARGYDVGNSMCEKNMKDEANEIWEYAAKNGCKIILPKDSICVKELTENAEYVTAGIESLPADKSAVDIGPESIKELFSILDTCKTLVWNGPLGVFEVKPFDAGTNAVAAYAAKLTRDGKLISVAGGGDTASAMENAAVSGHFTYISAAGGAFLEWLEGKELPGIAALKACKKAA